MDNKELKNMSLNGIDLKDIDLSGIDLDSIDLDSIDLKDIELTDDELADDELEDVAGGTRARRICKICGRPHSIIVDYGICRLCLRQLYYMYKKQNNDGISNAQESLVIDKNFLL